MIELHMLRHASTSNNVDLLVVSVLRPAVIVPF